MIGQTVRDNSVEVGQSGRCNVLGVAQYGRGNSASVDQSGEFSASRDAVLSEFELFTEGQQLVAEFTLRSGGKLYLWALGTVPATL